MAVFGQLTSYSEYKGIPRPIIGRNFRVDHARFFTCLFDLSLQRDENGQEINIDYARIPSPSVIVRPPLFPCTITPRSKHIQAAIQEAEARQNDK